MAKGRTRNARDDKKDKLAAGLKLSHKAKRQMKKAIVAKQAEAARGNGTAPSAHAVLRAQGLPEAKASALAAGKRTGKSAEIAKDSGKKKAKKANAGAKNTACAPGGGCTKCRGGHDLLLMRSPHDEYLCDVCDRGFLKKGSELFGCRLCDWDACRWCAAPALVTAELVREAAEDKAMREGKGREGVSREGEWLWVRKADSYHNRFMQIRHTGSGLNAELHCYSIGQFTFRAGTGAKAYCLAETGEVVPFQLSFPDMEKELTDGGGKPFPTEQGMMLGNWKLVSENGRIVGRTEAKEIKTSKHADKEVSHLNPKHVDSRGMGLYFLPHGNIVWQASNRVGDKAVLIEPFSIPKTITKEAALKAIAKG